MLKRVMIVLALAALSGLPAPAFSRQSDCSCIETSAAKEEWASVLLCAEKRTETCRALLKSRLDDRSFCEPAARLASLIIEEWQLAEDDPRLAHARRVWLPLPPEEEARGLLPATFEPVVVVASGEVTPEGTVTNVTLLRRSQYEELNELVASAFASACYRPARVDGEFVSQRVELLYRLEPQTTL